LSIRERRDQSRALRDLIGAVPITTVVLGDFNDWLWVGSVRGVLARVLPGRTRHRTFPAVCPILRLDRIYCRPAQALLSSFTDPQAWHVSDHLPVVADVEVLVAPDLGSKEGKPGL
jgi:endonuclease/exonuclease/phosphatase family metal-dependent hydrolase